MRIIVAGGRDFNSYEMLEKELKSIIDTNKNENIEIVSGGARGADTLGIKFAKENNIPIKFFPALWDQYGKSAGMIRNKQMAEYGDFLLAFWDGESHGTKNMIKTMKEMNKHGKVVIYELN